jgi:hypothetical protein
VDFASYPTISGHALYSTERFSPNSEHVKYHLLQFDNYIQGNDASGYCFEVVTKPPDYFPGVAADTRIWFHNWNTYTYQSLNDDYNGTRVSRGRIYVKGQGFVYIYIAAYSPAHNNDHFGLVVSRLNLTEYSCTTGQTAIPWVKSLNGIMTVSTNAN